MHKDNPVRSFSFFSHAGCLLPSLIILNLFFGWIFFGFLYWLLIEVVLILIFLFNSYRVVKKIFSGPTTGPRKRDDVIDVEGKVVDDKDKLK